ncbi:MAG TPA: MarR family transcriptional regulator [bacterium]|nr:MarR family transcriptional regulator [bacterium]
MRRIIRAVDIYSWKLNSKLGLTTPQLLCLKTVVETGEITLSKLTTLVNLSPSTVNGIVDRLEAKNFLIRKRSSGDRRKVFLEVTESGMEVVSRAPSLLQDKLSASLKALSVSEQSIIAESLEHIVELMEVEDIDASPNLISNMNINNINNKGLT